MAAFPRDTELREAAPGQHLPTCSTWPVHSSQRVSSPWEGPSYLWGLTWSGPSDLAEMSPLPPEGCPPGWGKHGRITTR